ncbi:MAG: DUF2147 domain-containing protein [Variovorax sp.]
MKRTLTTIALVAAVGSAAAQMTPVGTWQTVNEKTGEISSEVRISETNGVLSGRIEKVLRKDAKPGAVCGECADDRKDKPITGLEIIRGVKKAEGKSVWEDGTILDPENGKAYTLRLTPIDGGKKLEVRGSMFGIGRTQTWTRIQ